MKRNTRWLLLVVLAVLAVAFGLICLTGTVGSSLLADGVAPTPPPPPMVASVTVVPTSAAYLADGVAPTPPPPPMSLAASTSSSGPVYVADGVAPTPPPPPMFSLVSA